MQGCQFALASSEGAADLANKSAELVAQAATAGWLRMQDAQHSADLRLRQFGTAFLPRLVALHIRAAWNLLAAVTWCQIAESLNALDMQGNTALCSRMQKFMELMVG